MSKDFKNFQMYRVDGRNVFMEVMSSMIDKGKIVMNFIKYDANKPVGQRRGQNISIFMDLDDAKNFFYQASFGGFEEEARKSREAQKKGGYKYAMPVFQSLGGTRAETLKNRGQSRKDGKHEARVLDLVPGARQPWVLQAKIGGGKLHPEGLISMEGRPDFFLMVAFDEFEFRKMGLIVYDKIRLIEQKLAFGGDCDLDSIVDLSGSQSKSSIRPEVMEEEIKRLTELTERVFAGVTATYKNTENIGK